MILFLNRVGGLIYIVKNNYDWEHIYLNEKYALYQKLSVNVITWIQTNLMLLKFQIRINILMQLDVIWKRPR